MCSCATYRPRYMSSEPRGSCVLRHSFDCVQIAFVPLSEVCNCALPLLGHSFKQHTTQHASADGRLLFHQYAMAYIAAIFREIAVRPSLVPCGNVSRSDLGVVRVCIPQLSLIVLACCVVPLCLISVTHSPLSAFCVLYHPSVGIESGISGFCIPKPEFCSHLRSVLRG